MLTLRTELTKTLRDRGILAVDERVAAAWRGRLVEFSPWVQPQVGVDGPIVVLGVSAAGGHLLSRFGVARFDFAELRGPHSPYFGHLRFAIHRPGETRHDVHLVIRDAHAIAEGLRSVMTDGWEQPLHTSRLAPKRR